MRRILSVAIVILSVMLAQAPKGLAQAVTFPTLFDDFKTDRIDPTRWPMVFARGHEMFVAQGGRLIMELQAYGLVGTGPMPFEPSGRVAIDMADAPAATARGIQATINVKAFNLTGCGTVGNPSRVSARIFAVLFRDGPNPNPSNPDDQTGIVEAVFQVQAFPFLPPNTLRVLFGADRCGDSICSDELDVDLGFGRFQDVTIGQDVTVSIEWDALNNRIIFIKDNETLQTISYPPTFVVNTNPTQNRLVKGMRVRHRLETCLTRTQGFMSASFAEFRTKP